MVSMCFGSKFTFWFPYSSTQMKLLAETHVQALMTRITCSNLFQKQQETLCFYCFGRMRFWSLIVSTFTGNYNEKSSPGNSQLESGSIYQADRLYRFSWVISST